MYSSKGFSSMVELCLEYGRHWIPYPATGIQKALDSIPTQEHRRHWIPYLATRIWKALDSIPSTKNMENTGFQTQQQAHRRPWIPYPATRIQKALDFVPTQEHRRHWIPYPAPRIWKALNSMPRNRHTEGPGFHTQHQDGTSVAPCNLHCLWYHIQLYCLAFCTPLANSLISSPWRMSSYPFTQVYLPRCVSGEPIPRQNLVDDSWTEGKRYWN